MSEPLVIEFPAEVVKVSTMADSSIRLMLCLPEQAVPAMALLADARRRGVYLKVVATEQGLESRPAANWPSADRHWRGPEPQETIADEG